MALVLRIAAGKNAYCTLHFARVTQALLHFQKGMDKLGPWDDYRNRHKWDGCAGVCIVQIVQ
jgi:hypothetical protein